MNPQGDADKTRLLISSFVWMGLTISLLLAWHRVRGRVGDGAAMIEDKSFKGAPPSPSILLPAPSTPRSRCLPGLRAARPPQIDAHNVPTTPNSGHLPRTSYASPTTAFRAPASLHSSTFLKPQL